MKCQKCGDEKPDKEIQTSHDIPKYTFPGNKKQQRDQADKRGRHNLCVKCHDIYEHMAFWVMFNSLKEEDKAKAREELFKWKEGYFQC